MSDILNKIELIAKMAAVHGERRENLLFFGFDMGQGRSQMAAVGEFGETDDGMNILCFFSPCQRLSKGLMGGLSKSDATNLLRYNAQLPFGHFCVMELGDEETVCVRTTQILETMQIEEFRTNLLAVANAADSWEQKIGGDEF